LTANYDEFNRSVAVGEPDLVADPALRDSRLDASRLPAVESYLRSFGGTTTYLVVSDAMRRQAAYFGYLPDGSLDALETTLRTAPGWSVFHSEAGVTIYQWRG
jgi:hypothetical protein